MTLQLTPAVNFVKGRAGQYLRMASGKVWFWCPTCGDAMMLGRLHEIDSAGRVAPAAECGDRNCGWREAVTLGGWLQES